MGVFGGEPDFPHEDDQGEAGHDQEIDFDGGANFEPKVKAFEAVFVHFQHVFALHQVDRQPVRLLLQKRYQLQS